MLRSRYYGCTAERAVAKCMHIALTSLGVFYLAISGSIE